MQRTAQSKPSAGTAFEAFVSKLGWIIEGEVVIVPPNPDNQIQSTIVHENITLPRAFLRYILPPSLADGLIELVKVITHTARTA